MCIYMLSLHLQCKQIQNTHKKTISLKEEIPPFVEKRIRTFPYFQTFTFHFNPHSVYEPPPPLSLLPFPAPFFSAAQFDILASRHGGAGRDRGP